eukprot:COSAG02_NODE_4220_length_5616_cov_13.985862_2_plen_485_part_00
MSQLSCTHEDTFSLLALTLRSACRLCAILRKWSRRTAALQEQVAQLQEGVRTVEMPAAYPADVSSWSVDHVISWLTRVGLAEHYAHTFREHEIDGQTLCELDDSAWQTLGILKLGHQSVLRRAIADAVARQDAQGELGTEGATDREAVGRCSEEVCLLHRRVDELCSVLSAASARIETLEVDLEMKHALVAMSQAAAERRVDTALQTLARNGKQIATLSSVAARSVAALDAVKVKIQSDETLARTHGSIRGQVDSDADPKMLDVRSWSVDHVISWLTRVGLAEHYAHTFREHEIDGQTLCELDDSAWQTLGILKLGHQSVLRRAIADAVARQDAQGELGTEGATDREAVGRCSEEVCLLHRRVDELCSALSAASARIETLEVDLEMKHALVAMSQAAAERRTDGVVMTLTAEHAARIASLQHAIHTIEAKQNRLLDVVATMHDHADSQVSFLTAVQIQNQAAIESIAHAAGAKPDVSVHENIPI